MLSYSLPTACVLNYSKLAFHLQMQNYALYSSNIKDIQHKQPSIESVTSSSTQIFAHLLAHADLHIGVVDEGFPQVTVLLLLEALHVHPATVHVFSAYTHTRTQQETVHQYI